MRTPRASPRRTARQPGEGPQPSPRRPASRGLLLSRPHLKGWGGKINPHKVSLWCGERGVEGPPPLVPAVTPFRPKAGMFFLAGSLPGRHRYTNLSTGQSPCGPCHPHGTRAPGPAGRGDALCCPPRWGTSGCQHAHAAAAQLRVTAINYGPANYRKQKISISLIVIFLATAFSASAAQGRAGREQTRTVTPSSQPRDVPLASPSLL